MDDFKIPEENIPDPLAEPEEAPAGGKKAKKKTGKARKSPASSDASEPKKKGLFGKKKKDKANQIKRPDDFSGSADDINVDDVVSTYIPRRRARLTALALWRLDRTRLFILFAILVVLFLFLLSFMQEKMGNFTINLDRLELFRKGIAIADDGDFTTPTARLAASPVENATNISIQDLPSDLADIDGDHNGANYMAYTYYIRNAGKEDVSYIASLVLESCSKGAEEAVRVAVWHNGERIIYAEPAADGGTEDGCVNFLSDTIVCTYTEEEFLVGNVDKYTVVIWMEGDDPECIDRIVGGSVEFSMKFVSASDDDTTLLQKYIQDIIDTITGDKAISASGNESPDFAYWQDVTWDTRRNQEDGE